MGCVVQVQIRPPEKKLSGREEEWLELKSGEKVKVMNGACVGSVP